MRATIHLDQPISDADLHRISDDNPGWRVERASDGSLLVSPTGMESSARNAELVAQMVAYAKRAGGKAFGPDGGFTMPDGSVLSPDASWVREHVWSKLSADERDGFTRVVPAICIELRSRTDAVAILREKCVSYLEAGAEYVLVIDPYDRTTWSGGTAPAGFTLDIGAVFDA